MEKLIYDTFEYLTDVDINYWKYLLIITAPLIVFCVGPDKNAWTRCGRLIFAIGCTYVLLNLSLHTGRAIDWKEYEICQSQFPDGDMRYHKECPEINIADGASNIFYLVLGWIPGAAYVGIWEIIWRYKNRKAIKERGKAYRGKWLSNIIILIGIPIWICMGVLIVSLFLLLFR